MSRVCVLGMHGSGTSLVVRAVNLLRLAADDGPWPPPAVEATSLRAGQNEHLIRFNERLLARLGGTWDAPPKLSAEWFRNPDLDDLREEARERIVGNPRVRTSLEPMGDPRLSLVFPFWRALADIDTVIVSLHDPRRIAVSLSHNRGMDERWTSYLWLRYTLGAVHNAPEAHIVQYDRALDDPDRFVDDLADVLGVAVIEDVRRAILEHISLEPDTPQLGRDTDDPLTRFALRVADRLTSTGRPPDEAPTEAFATGHFLDTDHRATRLASDLERQLDRVRIAARGMRDGRAAPRESEDAELRVRQAADRIQQLQRDLKNAERRIRRLETQANETDHQRLRANRLRDELAHAHENQRQLQGWLVELHEEIDKLLTSRRWRIGSTVGDMVEWASPRRGAGKATDRMTAILEEFEAWKQAEDEALARKRAQRSESYLPGATGQAPRTTAGRGPSDVPEDLGRPRGVSVEEDRARRTERYLRWIEEVEPEGRMTGEPIDVHVLVMATPSDDAQTGFLGLDRLRRTLSSLAGVASSVTCLGEQGAQLDELTRDIELEVRSGADAASALRSVQEDWYLVLDPGDEASEELPHALAAVARPGDAETPPAFVCDHDLLTVDGSRTDPTFAPSWSPDLLLEHDYVGRGAILNRSVILEAGWEPTDVSGCLLRLAQEGREVGKIDRILVHQHPEGGDITARRRAAARRTERLLNLRSTVGEAAVREMPTGPRVSYRLEDPPPVSIIVPFRDRIDLLGTCVSSLLRWSTYPAYELLLVDNASDEATTAEYLESLDDDRIRILRYDSQFNFSALNNWAVEQARGDVVIFLNNDTKIVTHDWIEELVGYAVQPGIGMVGGVLHFEDGRIQHAGIVVGLQGLAGHPFAGVHEAHLPHRDVGYARNWSAVTAACAAVERDRFDAIGGFDESFVVTGSDVELGLRFRDAGYRNVVNPSVRLFHFEKQSRRGLGVSPVDVRRSLVAYRSDLRRGDPFWNSNLSLGSTLALPALAARPTFTDRRIEALRSIERRAPYLPEESEVRFLEEYDASQADLQANQQLLGRFRQNRELPLDRVTFFLPAFDHIYRGGIYTAMRIADHLSRTRSTFASFVMLDEPDVPVSVLEQQIGSSFPELKFALTVLDPEGRVEELEPTDAGICTLWTSAFHLMRWKGCRGKFYLVQDHEPSFYAAGSVAGLIEQTYRFGFPGIANTEGVAAAYRRYGNPTFAFTPGVDRAVFHPDPSAKPDDRIRIVFYGRPKNPRNAFELGTRALRRVKDRYGDAVEILSAGAEFDEISLGLDDVLTNLGVLPDIASVADLYRSSHIGLVLMFSNHPSYQPIEYMASGCATVTNVNEANDWLIRDEENARAAPATVSGLADAIGDLIEDPALRHRIVDAGLSTVEQLDWEEELEGIARFMATGEGAR